MGGQHPLVDKGAGGERAEVTALDDTLSALSQHIKGTLETGRLPAVILQAGRFDKDLPEARRHLPRRSACHLGHDRYLPPAEHRQALYSGKETHLAACLGGRE